MGALTLQNADNSNEAGKDDVVIAPLNTDGVSNQKETTYVNSKWSKYWGYFNKVPDLKSAMLMKAIWNVGKSYTTDPLGEATLNHITGWGKDTFDDIIFNMEVIRRVGGDAYAELIWDDLDKPLGERVLLNMKPLDPGSMRIVVDDKGIILRYEQITKLPNNAESKKEFKPEEIFHLSHNRMADQIHGISDIEALESVILSENETSVDMKALMHHQAIPFILWKLKTDKPAEIAAFKAKIENCRKFGNDGFIPDDENVVSYEVIQLNPNAIILEWLRHNTQKFYRALGMPLIVFGNGGTTESGGKIEYLAHEQVFARDQRYIEKQILNQLGISIKLNPPTSLLDNLQTDASKDGAMQQMNMQQSDVTAGSGR